MIVKILDTILDIDFWTWKTAIAYNQSIHNNTQYKWIRNNKGTTDVQTANGGYFRGYPHFIHGYRYSIERDYRHEHQVMHR